MPHPHALADTLDFARDQNLRSRQMVEHALDYYLASRPYSSSLDQIISNSPVFGFQPLANYSVRFAAQKAMIEALIAHYDRHRHDSAVRHFLVTVTIDDGLTFEDDPVVNFAKLELKVRRLFVDLGLQGVGAFDVVVVARKLPGEHARRLAFHVHAVCWTRDQSFKPRKTSETLSALPQWQNALGAPGVVIRSRAMSSAIHINRRSPPDPRFNHPEWDQTARSMAWLGYYLLKPPVYAMNLERGEDAAWRARKDAGAFKLKTAIRFAEIYSHISPADAVFAVGPEGAMICRDFAAGLARWTDNARARWRRMPELELVDVERVWSRYLAEQTKVDFTPSQIIHRAR